MFVVISDVTQILNAIETTHYALSGRAEGDS
jgi:hypothetical protein